MQQRQYVAQKAQNIYYLTLYRQSLLISTLYYTILYYIPRVDKSFKESKEDN